MGKPKRRKLLDPNFGETNRSAVTHNNLRNLYQSVSKHYPDLGIRLYSQILVPLNIQPSEYHIHHSKYFGVTIVGLLNSFKIDDSEGFFTFILEQIYSFHLCLGKKSDAELLDLKKSLKLGNLSVVVDPGAKYLSHLEPEWIIPFKLVE